MKSFNLRLGVAAALVGVVGVGTAIAGIRSFRHSALSCIPATGSPAGAFSLVAPSALVESGVTNKNTQSPLTVYCPVTMDDFTSALVSQPVEAVQVLFATNGPTSSTGSSNAVTCNFFLQDNGGGGTWNSWPPMSDTSSSLSVNNTLFQSPSVSAVQLANPTQSRAAFVCTIPPATLIAPGATAPNGIIKAYELMYKF